MPQQSTGSPNKRQFDWDDPVVILCGLAIVFFLCWATWYMWHTEISTFYVYLRYAQLYVFYIVGSEFPIWPLGAAADWVNLYCAPVEFASRCGRDFSRMQWREIADSAMYFNAFNGLLILLLSGWFFSRIISSHPKARFSKVHNVESFVQESKGLYSHLRTFGEIDLINMPLDHPVFGMSLTTRQFAFKHLLIADFEEEEAGFLPILDVKKAHLLFIRQLGKHWTSLADLSPSETLLFAIAIPRVAASDTRIPENQYKAALKDTDDMVEWCWEQFECPEGAAVDDYTWLQPDIDLDYPLSIIDKYMHVDTVQRIFQNHAYVRTILFEMFMQARRLGVLPPCFMRWMRFNDRETWYVLQNIGRQAGFAEGSAPMTHYQYECKSNEPIIEPQVSKAVIGLQTVIQGYYYDAESVAAYKKHQKSAADALKAEQEAMDNDADQAEDVTNNKALSLAADRHIEQLKSALSQSDMRIAAELEDWLTEDCLFLDVEKTGMGSQDQIIQIAVINGRCQPVYSGLVKPTCGISAEAYEAHRITINDLEDAPLWPAVVAELKPLLKGKRIGIYNAADLEFIKQSCAAHQMDSAWIDKLQVTNFMDIAQKAYDQTEPFKFEYILKRERVVSRGKPHDAASDAVALYLWVVALVDRYREYHQELLFHESK